MRGRRAPEARQGSAHFSGYRGCQWQAPQLRVALGCSLSHETRGPKGGWQQQGWVTCQLSGPGFLLDHR